MQKIQGDWGLVARLATLERALEFYANESKYEDWHTPSQEEAPGWSEEDFENAESTTVLLDGGRRAREALGRSGAAE